ncbi:MAG: TonB-dependent siderophore receptor [Acetobacter okinawensis]|uniref:TonB-dependent siderophore receptor n=1 Tax=Acetobacter okinawensis TaxID=1076594 RepID=UPI0039EB7298
MALLASSCLSGLMAPAAKAQPAGDGAGAIRHFTIAAQPLRTALHQYLEQSGVQVAYPTADAGNVRSTAISGNLTSQEALSRLLTGTGLTWRATGPNSVTLAKASANITLGPVRVGGTVAHQDPTGPGVGYVATTTMSGTKTDTPLMEIPNSIHVVTKQQIIDQQPQNIQEVLRYSPGIYSEAMGSFATGEAWGSGGAIYQRGFSAQQFVDGLMGTSLSSGEPSFLERVEAINGPPSVMYGQSAPGGLIDMTLKKPTDTPLHQASIGFGNWNRYEASIDVSDKITKSGNIRYRIAAMGNTQDMQTNYLQYQRVGVLPSITWDIDKKTSLTLIGSYMYTPDTGLNMGGQFPVLGTLITNGYRRISRSTFLGMPGFNEQSIKDAMFEYQFAHNFNKYIKFSQVFRWENSSQRDKDSYWDGAVTAGDPTLQYYRPEKRNFSANTISFDTRFFGKFDTGSVQHTWVVGSDFRHFDNHQQNIIASSDYTLNIFSPQETSVTPCLNINKSSGCNVGGYDNTYSYFQEGVYFQDQIKWKGLSVILGGRQDWVNVGTKGVNYRTGPVNTQHPLQSAFTWRAGVIYQFKFGLAPYFSYATSFTPQYSTNWQGKMFSPLEGKQLEAGLKYKLPNKDIILTAAAFHIDEDHYLINDPVHTDYSEDAGRVRSQGFEVAANANITRDLRVIASYSYTDIRFGKSNLTDAVRNPYTGKAGSDVGEEGKFVPNVPRNMFSVFADYTLPTNVLKGVGINWGMRYIGYTYATNVESFKTPAYVLFDIGAHYDFGAATPILRGLKAQLAISNLTNKYYVTGCGNNSCYLGQGRRVYGNLTYNW